MNYQQLKANLNQTSGILSLSIARPEAMNALNQVVLNELAQVLQEVYRNSSIKGVLLTGEGEKAFVAGADIKELTQLSQLKARELSLQTQRMFKSMEDSPKPIIAAVNGFALGGGCELAMACHMRIATENAKFGQPEVNLGIIPGYGGTQRLTQLVGRGKALEMMLTGDMISAAEAKAIGLVNHVTSTREEMIALAEKILEKILSKGPIAVANVIKSVNAGFRFEDAGYQTEATLFSECTITDDFKEGTTAFVEKRKAIFHGR